MLDYVHLLSSLQDDKLAHSKVDQSVFFLRFFFLFMAAWGLCCCAQAFSSCGEQGLLFVEVHRLLIAVASLVVEHGL